MNSWNSPAALGPRRPGSHISAKGAVATEEPFQIPLSNGFRGQGHSLIIVRRSYTLSVKNMPSDNYQPRKAGCHDAPTAEDGYTHRQTDRPQEEATGELSTAASLDGATASPGFSRHAPGWLTNLRYLKKE